jgi:hypothetical protein
MKSIGREKAIEMAESKWWIDKTDQEIVEHQLYTKELCMSFTDFHGAVERVFGRPVFTHEFANVSELQAEYEAKK